MTSRPLQRILGAPTTLLIGMGVAIGSGIFRTPGEVAAQIPGPGLILLAWLVGGVVALMQSMVTAELATRFPKAGGEYVFLREAFGEFAAFFFGWGYTLFVIGGGAATISRAFGDFACELLLVDDRYAGWWGASALVLVTGVNVIGLRAGAGVQNALTAAKVAALIGIVVVGLGWGAGCPTRLKEPTHPGGTVQVGGVLAGFLAVFWSYLGMTDAAKMAEEIKDVRRSLPRALIGSAAAVTLLYLAVNFALMRVVPAAEMAGLASVPGEAMGRLFGSAGRSAMLLVAMLVCLGSLGSTILATVRVTFALARDGLAFRFMSHMSRSQAPAPALIVVAGFALVLVLNRSFLQVLGIYFFASTFLFGLSYASLIVFRMRERQFPEHVYRCPLGIGLAVALIVIQLAVAANIAVHAPRDAASTAVLLGGFGLLYFVWKRVG